MAATSSAKDLNQKTFEHKWAIKNWRDVVQIDTLTESTKTEIKLEAENVVYAQVLLETSFDGTNVAMYWKLLGKHPSIDNLQVDLVAKILSKGGSVTKTFQTQTHAVTKTEKERIASFWGRRVGEDWYAYYVNSEGSLAIRLEFTLKNLPDALCVSETEEFKRSTKNIFSQNFAALLNDELCSDVTIVTKDNTELLGHKLILRAQCPVFASMFGSNFLESSTGVVNVGDISAKTMKILLNYWYTGELQSSWKDDHIVVEFAYAAGKYQMTPVLQMLDDMLGRDFKTSDVDVDLLRMVQQLHLENAKTRLTKRLIYQIGRTESGTELLSLFSLTTDNLDEESFGASKIFKAFDDALSENDNINASSEDVKLMALACKVGIKNIENKLLKRIVGTVVKMETADELFELFSMQTEESERRDLLVRVNPK